MLHKKIKLDIYNREIQFVCGDSKKCKEYLEKKYDAEFDTDVYGFCGSNGNDIIIYSNLTDITDFNAIIGTLAHEVFHTVMSLYDSIENAMNPDTKELIFHRNNTEPYAYVTGYIMEKAVGYVMMYIENKGRIADDTTTTSTEE